MPIASHCEPSSAIGVETSEGNEKACTALAAHKENVYVKRLQGAVQIRTETFNGAVQEGDDPRYIKFYELEAYLLETFPDVFANLKMEHFEMHSLLLTWQGSDASLSPYSSWRIKIPFHTKPSSARRARLSKHSARAIADHLEHKYGTDSIFMILDEGGGVMDDCFGRTWVAPATDQSHLQGSKGIKNVKVPPHTAIGILSALVAAIEAHPPPVKLSVGNPFADFAMWTIDSEFRDALGHERTWDVVARLMAERSPLLLTTQAVDIVRGGVKVNALPEEAHVIVNHRAARFNLSIVDFGQDPPTDVERYSWLEIPGGVGGEASPVTPARGGGVAFDLIAPTIAFPPVRLSGIARTTLASLSPQADYLSLP
ncbi:hypothetical protein B0H14DRAFT_3492482 [Mycena olivaceomarginata]|nr:hypothetical protein B0H14DRAFT_3492482 [Mycena olivaceomarginata]